MKRCVFAAAVLAALLVSLCSFAQAAVISEDIAYWYWLEDQTVATVFNPDAAWLQANLSSLIIKVQQTVYDPVQSAQILARDGQQPPASGYLFAYSVTNLNWEEGLTGFRVNWQIEPLFTTVSKRVTPAGWNVNLLSPVPEWRYSPVTDYGIAPGETVGGFWALSPIGQDEIVSAAAASVVSGGIEIPYWINGQTTGPVPDPAPLTTMLVGFSGLGLTRLLRRR